MAEEVNDKSSKKTDGICCPRCGCADSEVYYTRKRTLKINKKQVGCTVRVRICGNEFCGHEFETKEMISVE